MSNEIMKYELALDSMSKELDLEKWKVSLLEDEVERLLRELGSIQRRLHGLDGEQA